MRDRDLRVGLRWNDRDGTFVCDGLPDRSAAIGFVSDDGLGWRFPIQKCAKGFAVMGLRPCYVDPQRSPAIVYSGVNLTAATAA